MAHTQRHDGTRSAWLPPIHIGLRYPHRVPCFVASAALISAMLISHTQFFYASISFILYSLLFLFIVVLYFYRIYLLVYYVYLPFCFF